MKTIASVVENYIKRKPFLVSALSQGIINMTALSRSILPSVKSELGRDIKQGAIVMALKRLSADLEFRATHRIIKTLRGIGEITIRSGLYDYTYAITGNFLKKQLELLKELNKKSDVFCTCSRGVSEISIIASGNATPVIEQVFSKERLVEKIENLSSITVKLPKENIHTPGIYYFIFQRLSWEGVNIYEVISTSFEFTILINENEVDATFKVIKNLKSL